MENSKIVQESLQPQCITKDKEAYISVEDLAERLKKGDATNIALTGPYGSGKSSILKTLQSDYSNYEYLNISLATLKPADLNNEKAEHKDKNKGDGEPQLYKPSDGSTQPSDGSTQEQPESTADGEIKLNVDRLIEYSILQQLVYREEQKTLPHSRLKRIYHQSDKRIKRITTAILFAIASFIILFEPEFIRIDWLCDVLGRSWLNYIGDIISICYLVWFSYKVVLLIVPAISNSRLNKLDLKVGEIETVDNTSIFNKHLDEIIYFFERTAYNVVILEDLDRFNSVDVFIKLRELNLLLNNSKSINRQIVFIYAVRDDMFRNSDRVKCFDYITTVIPVINRSNAKDQLKAELDNRGIIDIDETSLCELGFFLNDMRLLKNIVNEYVQYRGKLHSGVSSKKLLGMIVYKNFYPQDFANLHDCKGWVYKLINLKDTFIAAEIDKVERLAKQRQELVIAHQKEKHLKESELRSIYVNAYREKCGVNVCKLRIDDTDYTFKEISSSEEFFNKLILNQEVYCLYHEDGYSTLRRKKSTVSFSEIERVVDDSKSYNYRLEALRKSYDKLEPEPLLEISKEEIRSRSLSQIMQSVEYQTISEYNSLNIPELIEFLVLQGYIDENYYDYISYFYGSFIDAHDWEFVLALKLNRAQPYNHKLNRVEAFINEIPNSVYKTVASLNVLLLDYLAEHITDSQNNVRVSLILKTAVEKKKWDFFAIYYQNGRKQDIVFKQLYAQYKNLWKIFAYGDDSKHSLKLSWFKYAEKDYRCDASREWLSQNFDFMTNNLLDITVEHWSQLIREGDYRFDKLNNFSSDILNAVIDAGAFSVNPHNVITLVSYKLNTNLEAVSLRKVLATKDSALIKRLESHMGYCLSSIYELSEGEGESLEAVVAILTSENANNDEKISYLKTQSTRIDLNKLDDAEIMTLAFDCDVVNPSWNNVIHYLNVVCNNKANDTLIGFIDNYSGMLASDEITNVSEDDEIILLENFIQTDLLLFEAYSNIVPKFAEWNLDTVSAIEERRVLLLIENGMLSYNPAIRAELEQGYSDEVMLSYLLKNRQEYLHDAKSIVYSSELAIGLLKSDMTTDEKTIVISCLKIDILNQELADEVIAILSIREMEVDLTFLLHVMRMTKRYDQRLAVLNYTLKKNNFNEDVIAALIRTLQEPYNLIAEKGRRPELPKDHNTLHLVQLLVEQKYISSYSINESGIRVNTKTK